MGGSGTNMNKMQEHVLKQLSVIASQGFTNAARGFSGMFGQELTVVSPYVSAVPTREVSNLLGGPENDAVGIYLRFEGDLSGQMMLIVPYGEALLMADMLLEIPIGTSQRLGKMERSALAEVGNLTGSFFLNAIAELTGSSARPSPPAVMVDMVGAILDVIFATMVDVGEEVLMFQSALSFGDRKTDANFWVIPDSMTLEKLINLGGNNG